jgi:hypothetical protein
MTPASCELVRRRPHSASKQGRQTLANLYDVASSVGWLEKAAATFRP